jgi:hypothetical protein
VDNQITLEAIETVFEATFTSTLMAKQKFVTPRRGSPYFGQLITNYCLFEIIKGLKCSDQQFVNYYFS